MVSGVHYSYIDMGDMKTWAVRQGMGQIFLVTKALSYFGRGIWKDHMQLDNGKVVMLSIHSHWSLGVSQSFVSSSPEGSWPF